MTVQKNLDFPWSMEDTIENLKELKEILQEQLRRKNYEGQGERDVKEIALDFDRAIQALEEVEQYRALETVEELKENKDFLEFLYNKIQPNEMEQYLQMYNAKDTKTLTIEGYADQCGLMSAT